MLLYRGSLSLRGTSSPSAPDNQTSFPQSAQVGTEQSGEGVGVPEYQTHFQESSSRAAVLGAHTRPCLHPRLPASNYPCLQSPASCLESIPPQPACLICVCEDSKKPQGSLCGKCIRKHEVYWKSNEIRIEKERQIQLLSPSAGFDAALGSLGVGGVLCTQKCPE